VAHPCFSVYSYAKAFYYSWSIYLSFFDPKPSKRVVFQRNTTLLRVQQWFSVHSQIEGPTVFLSSHLRVQQWFSVLLFLSSLSNFCDPDLPPNLKVLCVHQWIRGRAGQIPIILQDRWHFFWRISYFFAHSHAVMPFAPVWSSDSSCISGNNNCSSLCICRIHDTYTTLTRL
jgi:hypothetical protein